MSNQLTTDSPEEGGPPPPARVRTPSPHHRVMALAAAMLAPIALLVALMPDPTSAFGGERLWLLPGLIAGFALSERLVFHIEARSEAVSYSPSDLPLALGVLMVSPMALVAARVVGAGIGLLAWRRTPTYKLLFNLTTFALETLVAVSLFRLAFGDELTPSPLAWFVLVLSLLAALVTGGVLIAAAISFFEGGMGARIRRELTHSHIFYLPGAVVGASAAIPILIEPWLGLVFVLPGPLVWLVLRSHGALMHQYRDLTQVHDFSRQVGRSAEPHEIATTAVEEIASHLRAETVALVTWGRDGSVVEACHGERDVLRALPHADDSSWPGGSGAGTAVLVDARSDGAPLAAMLAGARVSQALVVSIADDRGLLGRLVVADRHGAIDRFSDDDRSRLEAICQQLAVALRKGQFHMQIQHEATHDRLTGLPNRSYFEAWADQMLASDRTGPHSVLMIDLDHFKEVNDTLGHHVGDQLLIAVSQRLEEAIHAGDVAARFGGDEFAVVAPGTGEHEAAMLATRISEALERPFQLGEAVVAVAGSIGIAVGPAHGPDCDTLLRKADLAMYEAKRSHSRYVGYRDDVEGGDSVRLALLGDLRDALAADQIDVYFQPKLDLRTQHVGAVEALARWEHAERGLIDPTTFIPLAEQAGLIQQLTGTVLDRSLAAVAHWTAQGRQMTVSVNISAQSLLNEELPRQVERCLSNNGVAPEKLILEITESTMMGDARRTLRILEQLDAIGVRMSVDDFGTGFSSLVNLRHLPIAEIKIDRSFVREMLTARNDEVIVRSIVDLGHNLGLQVVAEGVESADVEQRLRAMGCDLAQGFGIAKPLPLAKLDRWLELGLPRAHHAERADDWDLLLEAR